MTYSGEKAVILDWSAADEKLFIWQQTTDPEFLSKSGNTYSSPSTGWRLRATRQPGVVASAGKSCSKRCHANGWGITVSPTTIFEVQLPGSADRS